MSPKTAVRISRDYCDRVIGGKILAGKWIKLACERHLRDLETAGDRGFYFSETAAQHIVDFFEKYLRHSKGEWAGQPFFLQPWQIFCLSVQFGWLRIDNKTRRFRLAWNELPRKNGKSTINAGKGLYLLAADAEPGAEVYAAATKRDQAKIIWAEAARMVKKSPSLLKIIKPYNSSLALLATGSKFEPLGADSDTMDGLNVHGGLIDEIHAHKDRGVFDILETATGSRRQALIDITTTAGSNRHSIAFELHDYATKILERVLDDDTFFGFIAAADPAAEKENPKYWADENVWAEANPNIDISAKRDDLKRKCKRAMDIPAYQNTFKRLHLNIWTEQAVRWLDMGKWDACDVKVNPEELDRQPCFGGLDLSSTTDLTSLALIFDRFGQTICLPFFFLPEENLAEKQKVDRVPYLRWVEEGYLTVTPGNVIDYDFLREFINEIATRFAIKELGADPYNATQLSLQLKNDGLNIVHHRQTYATLSASSKELEALVLSRRLIHNANPVLRWNAANVAIQTDSKENIRPVKDASTGRIDGIVALIISLAARAMSPPESDFVYNQRAIYIG